MTTELEAPTPEAFSALTRNDTADPFVNPEALYVVAVLAVSATTVVHVAPASTDLSTR